MTPAPTVLSRRALNRALLHRQLLLERAPLTTAEALEHLVGMQSQAPTPPYTGLWTRLARFTPEDLETLLENRGAVRLVMMRSTIHLVTARDCGALRPVLAAALERSLTSAFGRDLSGLELAQVAAEGRRLVEQKPRTLGELGELLAERWPDRVPFALANAVRALVPLVQPPPRGLWSAGGPSVHTTASCWLGRSAARYATPGHLVERYLAAFGPATVKDMQTWSGMTGLTAVVRGLRPQLRTFRDEAGRELFDLPDAPLPDPTAPAPVRYLPEFDNVLLSHADRSRILTDEQRRRVFTRNGLIKPTFLVDGFVHGLWRVDRTARAATLTLSPFTSLARRDQRALAAEGERLLAFTAADRTTHELRFEEAG